MQLTGEQVLPVPRERVWQALNDPEVIRACVPGCESIERVTDTEFRAQLAATIGPVKAKFAGKLRLEDLVPPESYRLVFEGSGGAAGTAKGGARVSLAAEGAGTRLAYEAQATVGGRLAQVGSRLVDGVAGKLAEEFFQRLRARLEAEAASAPSPEPPAITAAVSLAGWGKWLLIAAALAAAAFIVGKIL